MAAADAIVLLSSSPPQRNVNTTPLTQHATMSSSPALPSPSDLFSRKTYRPSSAGRGNPIPTDTALGFANQKDSSETKRAKAPGKKATLAKRKSGDKTKSTDPNDSVLTVVEEPTSKPRVTKIKETTQTTIKKTKVTKVGSANGYTKDSKSKRATKKSSDIAVTTTEPSVTEQGKTSTARDEPLDLCVEEAVRRRTDWTPTKDTRDAFVGTKDSEGTLTIVDQGTPATSKRINHFGNLLGDYGYANITSSVTATSEIKRASTGEALTKRRKVELVATNICQPPEPAKPKRSKSPKKKPQTVTAKATAPFAALEKTPANNLLQYLAPDTPSDLINGRDEQQPADKPKRRSSTKTASKLKTATARATKASKQAPILLPPDKALQNAMDQELLFGTSSQLARDDSPTFVRDLQHAMKESESIILDTPEAKLGGMTASVDSGSTNGSTLSLFTASRNLWSAAARDLGGSLQEAEVVDLSITPKPKPLRKAAESPSKPHLPIEQTKAVTKSDLGAGTPDGWTNVDDIPSPEHPQFETDAERLVPKSLAEAALRSRPKSRSPVKKLKAAEKTQKETAEKVPPGMPNYKGFTASDLAKEIKSYHFKAVKKREDQIALLERCWESKNRIALQSLEPNVNVPQPRDDAVDAVEAPADPPKDASPLKKKRGRPPKAAEPADAPADRDSNSMISPPAKQRGRPKKAATEKTTPTKKPAKAPRKPKTPPTTSTPTKQAQPQRRTEIPDSDSETTPRPPSHHFSVPSQPPGINPPIPTSSASAPPTPLSRSKLLSKITQAISTYPPTHCMKNLTFYEKILLYDPIVLEDLAAWLNTVGLGRVGVDEEVSAAVVKEWCESQSVCCLWRENLRGGERKRW
ncbi:structure-specific endonuclease subunit slx4 [Physcia stellaris]|nr:structure-specific endonuclease subunit slx4 [Physcia stellaris]